MIKFPWVRTALITPLALVMFSQTRDLAQQTRNRFSTIEWVVHTHEVLNGISAIQNSELRAEDVERGFVLTGDYSFLVLYRKAVSETDSDIKKIAVLTSDNARQHANLAKAQFYTQERFKRMETVIAAYSHGGMDAARLIIIAKASVGQRRDVADSIETMRLEEERLLAERVTSYKATVTAMENKMRWMQWTDGSLILLIVVLTLWRRREG